MAQVNLSDYACTVAVTTSQSMRADDPRLLATLEAVRSLSGVVAVSRVEFKAQAGSNPTTVWNIKVELVNGGVAEYKLSQPLTGYTLEISGMLWTDQSAPLLIPIRRSLVHLYNDVGLTALTLVRI